MNGYVGHPLQLRGVEEYRLTGGKGDGIRLFHAFNGKGLELLCSPDRCGDIARLQYRGINLSYLSPCGYVAPAYYDGVENGWLKSFTAGFLTTCGLQAVGTPCEDAGERLPLHGSAANLPAERAFWTENGETISIHTLVRDETLFGRKLTLSRRIDLSLEENTFAICDEIENTGDRREPFELLYHMNLGYPLLDGDSVVEVPSCEIIPRDAHAAAHLDTCLRMEPPQRGYRERCYYHRFPDQNGYASIAQPKLGVKLELLFDARKLDGFVEWKMMGFRDYVLGLECGNCYPDGRDVMRKQGMLKFLEPGERIRYRVDVKLSDF